MNWLKKIIRNHIAGSKANRLERASMTSVVESVIAKETEHLEASMIVARLRAAKYDGLGRLTHTQEILRAQAVAQAETYAKFVSQAFREELAKRIVEEILR